MWYLPTYKTPKKGDIVIFYTDGGYNHTGIVTKVQGPKFWTIEGNTKKVNEVVSNVDIAYAKKVIILKAFQG